MANISIVMGSVYGSAQFVAEEIELELNNAGHQAKLLTPPSLEEADSADVLIVVTSTTGSGDIPENLMPFYNQLKKEPKSLAELQFAVVSLGDSSYLDSYCGAGKKIQEALVDLGARALSAPLELDAMETTTPEEEAMPWILKLLA